LFWAERVAGLEILEETLVVAVSVALAASL
jgi:hypothetical protein